MVGGGSVLASYGAKYSSLALRLRRKSILSAVVFVTGRALSAIVSTGDYRTGDLRVPFAIHLLLRLNRKTSGLSACLLDWKGFSFFAW
ncbi:MAG: hypothetical protein NHB14_08015 [Desulfosporosinus sp.]|nr:hypothetical protein [Desulfosporosinus sp.]